MDFDSPIEGKPRRNCGSLGGSLRAALRRRPGGAGSAAASDSQARVGRAETLRASRAQVMPPAQAHVAEPSPRPPGRRLGRA